MAVPTAAPCSSCFIWPRSGIANSTNEPPDGTIPPCLHRPDHQALLFVDGWTDDMVEMLWGLRQAGNGDSAAPGIDHGIHHSAAVYLSAAYSIRSLGYVKPIECLIGIVKQSDDAAGIAAAVHREKIVAREVREGDVVVDVVLAHIP